MEGVDAVGHRVVHGGPRLPGLGPHRRRGRRLPRLHHRPGAAAPACLAGRHRRGARAAAARAGRRVLRHGLSFDDAGGSVHVRHPARVADAATASAATASTVSRTPTRRAARRRCSDGPRRSLRVVTCHLGAGASLAAVLGGRSVDTTMGFTPLEGLVMATRSGTVDPGMVLWLQRHVGMTEPQLTEALDRRSGLLRARGHGRHARGAARGDRRGRAVAARVRRLRPPAALLDRGDGRGHERARRGRLHGWGGRERARGARGRGPAFASWVSKSIRTSTRASKATET